MSLEITPRELAQHIENGRAIRLIDVRQPVENAHAKLANSLLIPLSDVPVRAAEIPKEPETMIVVYCHHGVRSLSAAAYLRQLGFTNVASLAGGIDAWSCEVDPTVPRY